MFDKKSQQSPDLTTPENVKKGQQVYNRIVSGQCKDVTAELKATYGHDINRKSN
ncbi:hypothetical protein [Streptomyces rhizosphaerihabitans]|uniref:hypothetical protein n=1 Tax=Streptomyces rhizosphaerihabitans TaxID=1266770 RepID=UPI0021C08CF3|nr:hypothetical protein [Streptomyces rhizosphaerihabitans]MCT9003475.1 hypothetical protein [Streptomyces rhizosphaerihabitans]